MLKVVAADFAGKDAILQGMRRTATDLQKVYLQLETASKYGFKIAEKFFDRKSAVQGLTDEQEKLLKSIIKEESGESSGSKGKKGKKNDGKEELRGDNSLAGGPGSGAGPGWGFAPAFPYAPFMGNFAAGFSSMMMGGGSAPPNIGYGSGGYGRRTVWNARTSGVQKAYTTVKTDCAVAMVLLRRRGWTGDATITNCVMNTKI